MLKTLLLTVLYLCVSISLYCSESSQTLSPPSCTTLADCGCQTNNEARTVICENISLTEIPDLSSVGYPVEVIYLSHNLIEEIEDGSFSSTVVDRLHLDHNYLSSLPYNSLPTLTRLAINNNKLTKVPSHFLYAATKLKYLDLSNNPITRLDSFSFTCGSMISPLKDLSLANCNISEIAAFAFANLTNIESVELNGNNLTELTSSMLAGLSNSMTEFSASHCGIEVLASDALSPIYRLKALSLANNKIKRLEARSFSRMRFLAELSLENNEIEYIHKRAFGNGARLETIYLDNNKLESLHPLTFDKQENLIEISLSSNKIVTIHPKVFNIIPRLQRLDLGYNHIVEFPVLSVPKLSYFDMEGNNFSYIGADAFVNLFKLHTLKLSHNQFVMHEDALKPLTRLKEFIMNGNLMFTYLPNLTNNWNLRTLFIHHTGLEELPEDLCDNCPELTIVTLSENHLTRLPSLRYCSSLISIDVESNQINQLDSDTFRGLFQLQMLNLINNNISRLPDKVFADLHSVTDIYLQENDLKEIPTNTFNSTQNLLELNMTKNPVRVLQDGAFNGLEGIQTLGLRHMGIEVIEPSAFPNNMTFLLTLDLSFNKFGNLPMPYDGWPHLRKLFLEDVFPLFSAPTQEEVPELEQGLFTYTYHCCAFDPHERGVPKIANNAFSPAKTTSPSKKEPEIVDTQNYTPGPTLSDPPSDYCDTFSSSFNFNTIAFLCSGNFSNERSDPDRRPVKNLNYTEIIFVPRNARHIPEKENRFICYPHSDPMTPCEDLLGTWVLRVLIWFVFIVTLFGNGAVLTVILASSKPARGFGPHVRDGKIPHFLISQLAVAAIGIGIYLGFLAAVDLKTFGKQKFYQVALSWQYGPGCLAAGFIAILSSELSVYILVIIALERLYVHIYGMRHVKTHMCNAVIILIGWAFATAFALFPLIGYNSYTSVAICLPFDVVSTKGRVYIAVLMGINLVALLLSTGCSLYICCSYCVHTRSSYTAASDAKVFRFLCIIINNFLCWAPLVVVSLGAVFQQDLINTSAAKWFAVLVLPINACANPFIYALLTEKFRQQVLNMYHNAKRAMLPCRHNGIQPQRRNSTAFEHLHRPSTTSMELSAYPRSLGQNSPGSLSSGSSASSSAQFLGQHTSSPAALNSDGLRVGTPSFQTIQFLPSVYPGDSDSMPDLTNGNSWKPYFPLRYSHIKLKKPKKLSCQVPLIREERSKFEMKETEVDETKNSNEDVVVVSNQLTSDERSSSDSPSLVIGSPIDSNPGDGNSASSTSFTIADNSSDAGKMMTIGLYTDLKCHASSAIEETDV